MASTSPRLQFASALSTQVDTIGAVREVVSKALEHFDGRPDLAVAFASHDHGPDFSALSAQLHRATGARHFLGCTGEAIVATGREVEGEPAISLWLAGLPGVTLEPLRLEFARTPEGPAIAGWPAHLPDTWPPDSALLVLAEPYSFPADYLAQMLNESQPGVAVLGGMASGAYTPGGNHVWLDGRSYHEGAVAMLMHGAIEIRSVVSQGCRPVGKPLVVTKSDQQVVLELGGKPAIAQLNDLFQSLPEREQELMQQGVHLGRVINEYRDTFGRGDFLVRNCHGLDRPRGGIVVGDFVRVGQTVQFHVRDADSADEDLRELLAVAAQQCRGVQGGLLFTCNGRGTRLFEAPHHDAAALARAFGDVPLAGLFAQGEIGPVGGRNFVHGFTASVALFCEPGKAGERASE